MCSAAPYGYRLEPFVINGIKSKRLIVDPEEVERIKLMFEMYAQPHTSYGDITRYFAEQGILFYGKSLLRTALAKMLRNPVYVKLIWTFTNFTKARARMS